MRRFAPAPGFVGTLRALVTGAPGARRHKLTAHVAAAPSPLTHPDLPAAAGTDLPHLPGHAVPLLA